MAEESSKHLYMSGLAVAIIMLLASVFGSLVKGLHQKDAEYLMRIESIEKSVRGDNVLSTLKVTKAMIAVFQYGPNSQGKP